jgi:hypothetical protein
MITMDHFSKWTWIEFLDGKTSEQTSRGIAKVLEQTLGHHILHVDNGGEFRGPEFLEVWYHNLVRFATLREAEAASREGSC